MRLSSSGVIYNFGTISGNVGVATYNGSSSSPNIIENHGIIQGLGGRAIDATGIYDQFVENYGTIIGDVWFGPGDDLFVYNGGSISGEIRGGSGDDTLEIVNIEAGQVVNFNAQSGSDSVDVSGFGSAVWIDLEYTGIEVWTRDANTVASGDWRAIANVDSVENLTGTMGVDVLRGNAFDNTFTYVGEQGIGGQDRYDGRDGNDTVSFDGFTSAIWIDLSYTGSHVWTRDGDDLSSGDWRGIASTFNFENVIGTTHDDELRGDDNANVLAGGRGDDLLVGSGGFDTFVFDPHGGDDTIQDFDANDAERIDLSDVTQITDFIDLITNHLSSTDGTATIDYFGYSILLTGWTVADIGVAQVISADDFIF